jgi:hypothetical protein
MDWVVFALVCLVVVVLVLLFAFGGSGALLYSGGAASKSEKMATKLLEDILRVPFKTQRPAWLVWHGRRLELDAYNEKLGVALEFSGPLHTKWFPAQEEYIKYYQRIVKDRAKRKLCKQRGVKLIVLDMSLPRTHWRDYLRSRLYDYGLVAQPSKYIEAQKARPYRNKPLERELGLGGEFAC